ncbi:MAG: patatin-like phospholipase family protein [Pseudomonadota bacterium]
MLRSFFLTLAVLSAAACSNVLARNPAPANLAGIASPYGIESESLFLRSWGDEFEPNGVGRAALENFASRVRKTNEDSIRDDGRIRHAMLALSGGGADGAFGAGLLAGWTKRGDRPEFSTVTGVSTGAIIALYAFLGPDYDDVLREVYTEYETSQLLERTLLSALTGGAAVTATAGYKGLIERYVDEDVMQRLREASDNGRTLLIGTTNLDAARPVIWNVSSIAATRHPQAEKLIEDIIRASSAIPGVFPPVLIPVVSADGETYDEMHVDGGATQQVMLFSPGYPLDRIDKAVGAQIKRELYVVMNNKLDKPYRPVAPRLIPIASAAASSLLGGSGTGDIYKIFAIAERDEIDLNVVTIPEGFDAEAEEVFDPEYMTELYKLGFDMIQQPDIWSKYPPGFVPD